MRLSHILRKRLLALSIAAALGMQLAGCGGSQLAAGVGSGGSGVAEGSVTGFGSVIVEGDVYGDSNATVERWGESGVAEVKLGQRVRVLHDESGQATRIVVLPQLMGHAATAPDSDGEFTLLGQRVRVVGATNADYPATVFDGLTQVRAGDALEVHGSWSRNAQGVQVLIASRIEKLASSPDPVLLTSLVGTRLGNVLTLNDAGHTPVTVPNLPDTVQAGALVSLWLARSAVQTPASVSAPWVAERGELASASVDSGAALKLRAVVSDTDSQQGRIRVQGLWVRLPSEWNPPAAGTPVQLSLQRSGNDWQASSLSTQRSADQPEVQIKGSLIWNSSTSTLQLRGTSLQLPANLLTGNCAGLQDGEQVYVDLKAQRRSPGLPPQVSAMKCLRQIPDASVQEARATVVGVDTASRSVQVRAGSATLSLTWVVGQTLMPPVGQLQAGMTVEIEYQRSSNGLLLRKLKTD